MSKVEFEMKLNDIAYWIVPLLQTVDDEGQIDDKVGYSIAMVEISCAVEINRTAAFYWNEFRLK